jgi:hypothetical protein
MRAAIYWAPGAGDLLARLGNEWLGRDAERNVRVRQPGIPGIEEFTAAPRHYGFHCTLRPPMRLATGWNDFHAAARRVAAATRPFSLPPLQLQSLDGFLALTLACPCADMQALADRCVAETNACRLAPGPEELARRRAAGLSPRQEQYLQEYGYPYVMQEWLFHLTLTCRLSPAEGPAMMARAADHFAAALAVPRRVEEICIFTQNARDFLIAERIPIS